MSVADVQLKMLVIIQLCMRFRKARAKFLTRPSDRKELPKLLAQMLQDVFRKDLWVGLGGD